MFSRRKKNYRVFVVTALIITLCVLIAVILWPSKPIVNEPVNTSVTEPVEDIADEPSKEEANNKLNNTNDEEQRTSSKSQSYYMVKKNGHVISVYFITESGEKLKLEDTEILYDLLPPDDQEKFDTGIIIEHQEDLASLLQDFEG